MPATIAPRTPLIGNHYGKHQERYLELIRCFPLRPIRSEADLVAATEVARMLYDKPEEKLLQAERDYLDVLDSLIIAYEDVQYPMNEPSDGSMLRFLLEQKGVTQAALSRDIGLASSTVSGVLSGRRTLTRSQIGKLTRYFKVEPGVFRFVD